MDQQESSTVLAAGVCPGPAEMFFWIFVVLSQHASWNNRRIQSYTQQDEWNTQIQLWQCRLSSVINGNDVVYYQSLSTLLLDQHGRRTQLLHQFFKCHISYSGTRASFIETTALPGVVTVETRGVLSPSKRVEHAESTHAVKRAISELSDAFVK